MRHLRTLEDGWAATLAPYGGDEVPEDIAVWAGPGTVRAGPGPVSGLLEAKGHA
jgi:hypothetical protein